MGKEHQPEIVFKAQELYCVLRWSMKDVAKEVGVAVSTLWRWCKTYEWKEKRKNIAQAECDIRADTVLARSALIKELLENKNAQIGFAVASLETLAMKQAEAERAGQIIQGQLEAPVRKIESKADAVAALREAVERKLTSALLDPEGTDVLALAKQIKEANALIDSMAPKDEGDEDKKNGLSSELEEKIRNLA